MKTMDNVAADSNQFLRYLADFNDTYQRNMVKVLLVTWDIESMFLSIDNTMSINACSVF